MASIKKDIVEFQDISIEIKRLLQETKRLRGLKNECEARIIEFLENNDQPGIRHKDLSFVIETKEKRKPRKKREKINNGSEYLSRFGVQNPEQVLDGLFGVMRGSPERAPKLKTIK